MEESEIYEALGLEAPEAEDTPPEPEEGPAEDGETEPPEGEQEGAGGEPGSQLPQEPIQAPTPAPAPAPREMPRQEGGGRGICRRIWADESLHREDDRQSGGVRRLPPGL